jgi:PilZ domain-containing protein
MEHRCSPRCEIELNVLVYQQQALKTVGVLKNIGASGVFIEGAFEDIGINQTIEIHCFLNEEDLFENCRLDGVVVHKGASGIGVEIEEDNLQEYFSYLWWRPNAAAQAAQEQPLLRAG